jgi:hypothetical protein
VLQAITGCTIFHNMIIPEQEIQDKLPNFRGSGPEGKIEDRGLYETYDYHLAVQIAGRSVVIFYDGDEDGDREKAMVFAQWLLGLEEKCAMDSPVLQAITGCTISHNMIIPEQEIQDKLQSMVNQLPAFSDAQQLKMLHFGIQLMLWVTGKGGPVTLIPKP